MTVQKPTVLFVHGLWHTPAHFKIVRTIFENAGYPTSCNVHPSVGTVPELGLQDDATFIRGILHKLIDEEGKDVIVVCHSYGGMVTSEAADAHFAKQARLQEGKRGGILHLVYMCAFLLAKGSGIVDAFGGILPPGLLDIYDNGMCSMSQPAMRFYHDVPVEEQQVALSELRLSPTDLNYTPQIRTNYLHHPLTYFYCENDQGLPFAVQQAMVNNARNAGVKLATEHCTASHSPFLSMPDRVLQLIENLNVGEKSRSLGAL